MKKAIPRILFLTVVSIIFLPQLSLAHNSVRLITAHGIGRMLKVVGVYIGVCLIPIIGNMWWKSVGVRILSILLLFPQLLFLLLCFAVANEDPSYSVLVFVVICTEIFLIVASRKRK